MGSIYTETGERFSGYIEEIRQLAGGGATPVGSPVDLETFAERLNADTRFRDQITSLVRATIFRENAEITQAELLELVVLAIGGPAVDTHAPGLNDALESLSSFLGQILRSLWVTPASSGSRARADVNVSELPPPVQSGAPESAVAQGHRVKVFEEVEVSPDTDLHPAPAPPQPVQSRQSRSTMSTLIAQATRQHLQSEADLLEEYSPDPLFGPEPTSGLPPLRVPSPLPTPPSDPSARSPVQPHQSTAAEPEDSLREITRGHAPAVTFPRNLEFAEYASHPNVLSRLRSLWREPDGVSNDEEDGVYPEYSSWKLFSSQPRSLWLVGICGLLLGIALGVVLWRGSPSSAAGGVRSGANPTVSPAQPVAAPGSLAPLDGAKPSPYTFAPNSAQPYVPSASPQTPDESLGSGKPVTSQDWNRALGLPNRPGRHRSEVAATPNEPAPSPPPPAAPAEVAAPPNAPRGDVFIASSGAMAAHLLSAPSPAYPVAAREAHVQGEVALQVVVGLEGEVVATRVLSGPPALRGAAQQAVRLWRYQPYMVGSRPSMITTTVDLDYRLNP